MFKKLNIGLTAVFGVGLLAVNLHAGSAYPEQGRIGPYLGRWSRAR